MQSLTPSTLLKEGDHLFQMQWQAYLEERCPAGERSDSDLPLWPLGLPAGKSCFLCLLMCSSSSALSEREGTEKAPDWRVWLHPDLGSGCSRMQQRPSFEGHQHLRLCFPKMPELTAKRRKEVELPAQSCFSLAGRRHAAVACLETEHFQRELRSSLCSTYQLPRPSKVAGNPLAQLL